MDGGTIIYSYQLPNASQLLNSSILEAPSIFQITKFLMSQWNGYQEVPQYQ